MTLAFRRSVWAHLSVSQDTGRVAQANCNAFYTADFCPRGSEPSEVDSETDPAEVSQWQSLTAMSVRQCEQEGHEPEG